MDSGSSEGPQRCAQCGAELRAGASFCGACGTRVGAVRSARDAESGAIAAIAVTFIGTLVALLLSTAFPTNSTTVVRAIAFVGFTAVGAAGALALGRGAFKESLGGPSSERWMALALVGGLASFAVSWGYATLVSGLLGGGEWVEVEVRPLWLELLETAAITPLVEEWLCRGVMYLACARVVGTGTTLVLTSSLFALLHGLEGHVFSLPHRFVAGLVFGWLRERSGSLLPGVLAHAVHNALAVFSARM